MRRILVAAATIVGLMAAPAVAHHRCWHNSVCPTPTPTAIPTPAPTPSPEPAPLFVDEFDGPAGAPPSSVWSQYPWAPTGTTQVPGAARLDGEGNLELVVRDQTEAAGVWTKDRFIVAPPFEMTAWARFPASWEVWHSWWWQNVADGSGGEVDAYENGGLRDRVQGAVHEWSGYRDVASAVVSCPVPFDPTTSFHRYSVRVTGTGATFLQDGVVCATLSHAEAPFARPGYVVLTLWPSNAWGPSGFPSVLNVARVEVRSS